MGELLGSFPKQHVSEYRLCRKIL